MTRLTRRTLALPLAIALALAAAAPAFAQEETPVTTISQIDRGAATGEVYLEGAALWQLSDEEYVFSDGTGSIAIDIDTSTAESRMPMFELIGISGEVASGEIDVSEWELLPIITAAVIIPEEQVIQAYRGWIVAYGGQAPTLPE